ncbi:hypothetical protein ACRAQ7_03840 [Erythrobacter sp. W53]|uniref:hypothetical protein n=1 Tax=Erythrobacter sp. W53 TaxID=3425947 RepID=UPI003D768D8B
MKSETVLEELAKRANPEMLESIAAQTGGELREDPTIAPSDAPPATAGAPDSPIYDNISAAYRQLRIGMALIAILMPIWLVVGGGLSTIQTSLSAYYHFDMGKMRDVFVGILWAIGAFLFFYKGYTRRENAALTVAGLAAVVVAMVPMACNPSICAPSTTLMPASGSVHGTAAIIFFLLVAYVCIFRSRDTLQLMTDAQLKARFTWCYRVLGCAMVILPIAIFLLDRFRPSGQESFVTIAIETAGIFVFAIFWLVKSREIRILEQQLD